jgi:hypothetical protein
MANDFNDDTDGYDILDDINPEDYILVLDGTGKLRGISLPESIEDEDDVPDTIAKVITLLLEHAKQSKPSNASLH